MTPPAKSPSLNPLSLKQRMNVLRQHMPEQLAQVRATNFTEVNLGYSTELARQEALRCLECAKPACTDRCPVGVKVRDFVQLIVAGDFLAAAAKIRGQRASCHHRPRLSTRGPPRRWLPDGKEGPVPRHRVPAALCRRLSAAASRFQKHQEGPFDRKESRHRRKRSLGPDCRG